MKSLSYVWNLTKGKFITPVRTLSISARCDLSKLRNRTGLSFSFLDSILRRLRCNLTIQGQTYSHRVTHTAPDSRPFIFSLHPFLSPSRRVDVFKGLTLPRRSALKANNNNKPWNPTTHILQRRSSRALQICYVKNMRRSLLTKPSLYSHADVYLVIVDF